MDNAQGAPIPVDGAFSRGRRLDAVRMRPMLAAIAERNGGPFRVRDAYEVGYSPAEVRWLVSRGAWIQLHRGVLLERALSDTAASDPVRRHALEVAGWLVRLDGCAAASHDSAALLHELDVLHRRPERPPVTLTRHAGGWRSGWHRAALPSGHRERVHGAAVTTCARTVVDLARVGGLRDGVVVADSALHRRRATRSALDDVMADCRGWPGIERARRVVSFADGKAESVLESLARVTLHDLGLPPPQLQVWIGDEWFWIGRVDFCWPSLGVVAEADGMLKYTDVRVLRNESDARSASSSLALPSCALAGTK